MAKNIRHSFRELAATALILLAAGVMTGCQHPGQDTKDSDEDNQQVLRIGVNLPSPGLISGISSDDVSGIEVDLAVAVAQELDLISTDAEIAWVPMRSDAIADGLASGDLDFGIGQLQPAEPNDDVAWVGPYVDVTAALLVRADSQEAIGDDTITLADTVVTSLADLDESAVCIVEGSAAQGVKIPADEMITQRTVSECETGMRSGRYDAVAADDLQLAGVLVDKSRTESYQMLKWPELTDDDDAQTATDQYWIGTTPQHCEAAALALQQLAEDGTLDELLNPWDKSLDYSPALVQAGDISAESCS